MCSPTPCHTSHARSPLHPFLACLQKRSFWQSAAYPIFQFWSYAFVKGRGVKLQANLSIYRVSLLRKLEISHFKLVATQKGPFLITMSWFSILPPNFAFIETWLIRIFVSLLPKSIASPQLQTLTSHSSYFLGRCRSVPGCFSLSTM